MEGAGGSKKECSSKASSDDHSSTDQSTDDVSSGRSYECIFCKRGFSTAQALGGHMNIHRKDRAKMKHNPSASKVGEDESEGGYGYYNPYINYHNNHQSFYPPVSEYSTFFPAAASSRREDVLGAVRPQELSLFGEDHLHLGLRVHGDERHVVLGCEEKRERAKEGEVDLELRLGP